MSNTCGLTHGPPAAGGRQIPTSIPPLAAWLRFELSSWYWTRAPGGGSHRAVAAASGAPPATAIVASNAAANKPYWPWLWLLLGVAPTTSQMM